MATKRTEEEVNRCDSSNAKSLIEKYRREKRETSASKGEAKEGAKEVGAKKGERKKQTEGPAGSGAKLSQGPRHPLRCVSARARKSLTELIRSWEIMHRVRVLITIQMYARVKWNFSGNARWIACSAAFIPVVWPAASEADPRPVRGHLRILPLWVGRSTLCEGSAIPNVLFASSSSRFCAPLTINPPPQRSSISNIFGIVPESSIREKDH